ncbi:tripartite motif-containing protein 65-like isoform X2 [Acipenser oxyrinchus oxyrinchus]|uniref:Tripartite motif-containing protein 65-like isoform X2 n=1 Tax=Acipenser oxyrinchus oxyrinchus TaxID=40147 RepID=A0AAD8D9S6_ACIOX|nr:tripartite motif-containing protein 65-like isoform X2 [Acipenser oxyrinchus oxyrinchus]
MHDALSPAQKEFTAPKVNFSLCVRKGLFTTMDNLDCAICLDLYKTPVTIPCGHNFCMNCISEHWDKDIKEEKESSCPQCRRSFPSRPELKKNIDLSDLVDKKRKEDSVKSLGPPSVSRAAAGLCSRHGKAMELYCEVDKMCICCACIIKECSTHKKVLVEDERKDRETKLIKMSKKVDVQIELTEKNIAELKENIDTVKELSERTAEWLSNKFCHLLQNVKQCQEAMAQYVEQEKVRELSQAEENLHQLEQSAETLRKHLEQTEALLKKQDDVQFLQESQFIDEPPLKEVPLTVTLDLDTKVTAVTDLVSKISKLILEDLQKVTLAADIHEVQDSPKEKRCTEDISVISAVSTKSPIGECYQAQYRPLSFDPHTAHKYIRLSCENRKAEHISMGVQKVPAHEARFEGSCWQVLCAEGLEGGKHYWEVDISHPWVYLGVAYSSIKRKEKDKQWYLGMNKDSWSLRLNKGCCFALHGGKEERLGEHDYKRIGLFLDYPAGILIFYGVGSKLNHLHTFHTVFSQPLYPAFWIGEGVSVTLL